ncbi:hypothetical protein Hanom_Chr06g00555321 [Helianthus anomalus]
MGLCVIHLMDLMEWYSGRKHDAKAEFINYRGCDDIDRARVTIPKDMPCEKWQKTVDHFIDPKYISRCQANKKVCQLQQFPNRDGTALYGSTDYKIVTLYFYVCVCVCVFFLFDAKI